MTDRFCYTIHVYLQKIRVALLMFIVVTYLNLWLFFFSSLCCKTDRFRWSTDKFWFGGIVRQAAWPGASKLIRRLFHRLLPAHFIAAQLFSNRLYSATSLLCCSTILYKALLCYYSAAAHCFHFYSLNTPQLGNLPCAS